jgi:tripartite-type tricarboxylate transporter receptor subunit TctC
MLLLFRGAALVAAAAVSCALHAQAFPSKPIRVIIPFVAGGSSDIVGRAIGSKFQEFLGQPAVVENKPGANGAIAAEFVAKSEADGHTILVGSIGVLPSMPRCSGTCAMTRCATLRQSAWRSRRPTCSSPSRRCR